MYEELERVFDLLERIDPQYRQFATLTESRSGRTGFDLLLEAASLDDVHAKYYSSIPRDTFERIVSADPTSGTDKMGRYGKWLLGLYKGGRLKEEDLYKAKQYLSLFDKFKGRLERKDIGQYGSLPALYDAVRPFESGHSPSSKSEEERMVKREGAKKVYESPEWLVVVPLTREAACLYGKGTQWCTAAETSDNYFDYYNDQGPLYININRRDGRKYQIHFESKSFMDARDEKTDAEKAGFSEGLIKFYVKRIGESAIRTLGIGAEWILSHCDDPEKALSEMIEAGNVDLSGVAVGDFVVPDSVTTISDHAFYGCSGLTSVTIGNSVTTIGNSAFFGCFGLESVTIPDSVTSIGDKVLYGCYRLRNVTIPDSVTIVGYRAFAYCDDLTVYVGSERVARLVSGSGFKGAIRYIGTTTNPM